jgi:hypothetical protein
LPIEISREGTEMNSTPGRAQLQTQREQFKAVHALCEQVRRESRAVIERNRIVRDASRAALARSRARRASSLPGLAA